MEKEYYEQQMLREAESGPHPGVQYRPPQQMRSSAPGITSKLSQDEQRIQCYKYLLFSYNLLLFITGCILLGIGIWMAVDRNFITYMVGNNLYMASIFMILIGGFFIFIISFFGCCGTITENKCMLFSYFVILALMFFVLLIGGILAGVFRGQVGEAVKGTMSDTLVNHYAVDLHEQYNRWVTDAWDKAQERLECCGVTQQGWRYFRETRWFEEYGAQYELTGRTYSSEHMKPYVPKSCCVKDRFWRYINVDVCQKWRLGPPGSPDDGAINRALYYDGCYDVALSYIKENSAIIIGLGISVALLLIAGIFLSFMLFRSM